MIHHHFPSSELAYLIFEHKSGYLFINDELFYYDHDSSLLFSISKPTFLNNLFVLEKVNEIAWKVTTTKRFTEITSGKTTLSELNKIIIQNKSIKTRLIRYEQSKYLSGACSCID